jgi:hypothetical protein
MHTTIVILTEGKDPYRGRRKDGSFAFGLKMTGVNGDDRDI